MLSHTPTVEHSYLPARKVRSFENFKIKAATLSRDLKMLGIGLDDRTISKMISTLDNLQPTVTQGSISTPLQFLQNWLPGFVAVTTDARKIDELVGLSITGTWEQEQIIQQLLELTGTALPYGDQTNIPYSSWNVNQIYRTIIRFEEGLRVGQLEARRAAAMRVDSGGMKRDAAALSLEIQRNTIGFFGYNNGANNTYGFLNDPGLPSYVNVSGGTWATKTFLQIQSDLLTAVSALRTQSGDLINPKDVNLTLAVAMDAVDYLQTTSDLGISVENWLNSNYPKLRIVSAPELDNANSSANVFYLYAESIKDRSTDDGRTFIQSVPTKFLVLGVQQQAKDYIEDYSNATAGVMCKRPWAIVRFSGI